MSTHPIAVIPTSEPTTPAPRARWRGAAESNLKAIPGGKNSTAPTVPAPPCRADFAAVWTPKMRISSGYALRNVIDRLFPPV
jgi:hypothetical protein